MTALVPSSSASSYRSVLGRRGYVVVEDVFDDHVLDGVLDAMACQLGAWARSLVASGLLGRTFEACSLEESVIRFAQLRVGGLGQALDISLPQGSVEHGTPMLLAPEVFALLSHPSLLDVLEQVLGPEIWLSPVGHTRMKVPSEVAPAGDGLLGHVPWHQDNAVLLEEADDVEVVTAWVPLVDVDKASGCLQVVPTPSGEEILPHCPGEGGLRVPATLLPQKAAVPVEMRRGSVLLMHSRTLHSSMPNDVPGHVRFSLDLRYQPVSQPTGRPAFPSFCLRSPQRAPATFPEWRDGWARTREELAGRQLGKFNRWGAGGPVCA